MKTLKVSSKSVPSLVAGAIAGAIRENEDVELNAVGANATNQAVKAIAIARSYIADMDCDLACVPEFVTLDMGGGLERTGIRLKIEKK